MNCAQHGIRPMVTLITLPIWGQNRVQDRHGLPWGSNGKEFACQCRRHRFDPWSRQIPQFVEQIIPCIRTIELVLWSLGAALTEPTSCNYGISCTLQPELGNKRSNHCEKRLHCNWRVAPARHSYRKA